MRREELKEILLKIREEFYEVPKEIKPFDLALDMLSHIGDVDSELRDNLIYMTFYKWIINDVFTKNELNEIVNISLDDNHLFYKLGDKNDSVFRRSFSVLLLPIVLYKHRQDNYLKGETIKLILNKVIDYIENEKDLRGYIEGKGWAHAAAHTADALDELVKCNELNNEDLMRILNTIQNKISVNYYLYVHEEDERMTTAVMSILNNEKTNEVMIIEWVEKFVGISEEGNIMDEYKKYLNIKNFLRSLYFRTIKNEDYKLVTDKIKKILDAISKF